MAVPNHRRILYVCVQGLEPGQGAETHVRAIVEGLRRTHDVTLIAPAGQRRPGLIARGLRLPRLLVAAGRAAGEADVVYLRHHPMLLPLTWWLRRRGIPQVQEINGPIADFTSIYPGLRLFGSLLHRFSRTTLGHAARVVAVSAALAESVREQTGLAHGQVVVVHNGADLDTFSPTDEVGRYVVFVGALTPWQGLATLAAATTDAAWPSSLSVVVAGDGPSRHLLAAAAPGVIEVCGTLAHHEVARLVAGALSAISPKTPAARWSSPLKVYEAIASGVPSIVTDVGEQADLIRDFGCGIVVAPDDAPALADAVRRLNDDRPLRGRLAAAAVQARPQVSWASRVRLLSTLLDEAAQNGPAGGTLRVRPVSTTTIGGMRRD